MNKSEITMLINEGKYDLAFDIIENNDIDGIRNTILEISYDTESISVLGFSIFALNYTNDEFWFELVIEILLNVFSFIEGAYSMAFYYSRKVSEMNRSKENLIRLLFFYELPEKLLKDDEAAEIANEILLMDSSDMIANEVLSKIGKLSK